MGKASRRKDVVDVIKEHSRKEKRDAGMRRSNVTGISASALSAIGPSHTLGEGDGTFTTGGGDLNMHTYDIVDVDRLKFSTMKGSEDFLIATDHGIESASYYIPSTNTMQSFGMNFRIPDSGAQGLGMGYYFKIGNINACVISDQEIMCHVPLTLHADSETGVYDNGSLYFDGTDIQAKVAAGTVNLTSGGQTWLSVTSAFDGGTTGVIRVGLTGQTNASRVIINSWAHFSGYFNVKDSGGTDRKVPYI